MPGGAGTGAARPGQARTTQDTTVLREMGLKAVRTAGRDTLCAMAMQAAVQDGVEVNRRADPTAESWLCVAARDGLVETLRALLVAGAEVNHATNSGCTVLQVAAQDGHTEALRALREAGAEVNQATNAGWTALHVAAHTGHLEIVHALVVAGADLNRAINDGRTPLAVARGNRNEAVAQALVQAGATE